jgi:outer membrane protein assembly factor BamD
MDHRARRLPRLAALTLIGGLLGAVLLGTGLSGCQSDADLARRNQIPDEPAEALYNQGMAALQAGNISDATRFLEEVETQHPYSAIAPQAQIMDAYAITAAIAMTRPSAPSTISSICIRQQGRRYAYY